MAAPFWIIDLFRRRYDHQGPLLRAMSRAAFAAFVIHQAVLVGLILLIRRTPWPPELEYLAVSAFAIAVSFGLGGLALRVPAIRRVM